MKLKGLAVFSIALMALFAAPQAASDVREFVSGVERHLDIAFLHAILKSHDSKPVSAPAIMPVSNEKDPAAVCSNSVPRSREIRRSRSAVRSIARNDAPEISFIARDMPQSDVVWQTADMPAPIRLVKTNADMHDGDVVTFKLNKDIPIPARLNLRNVLNEKEWNSFVQGAREFKRLKVSKDFQFMLAPQPRVNTPNTPQPHLPVAKPVIPPAPPARAVACAEIAALDEDAE
jgi:hypothetical protein